MANMANKKMETKALAKHGAYRLTREEVLKFMRSQENTLTYSIFLIQAKNGVGALQLGYIMFKKLREGPYMKAWRHRSRK